MADEIWRQIMAYERVEVPEGFIVCKHCKGKGMMSKYDEGWNSICHSPELAALHPCIFCGGKGYVRPYGIPPGGFRIATEFDCMPTRARGVLRYISRLLWDRPPKVLLDDEEGPWLWRFNFDTGYYEITNRRQRGEVGSEDAAGGS